MNALMGVIFVLAVLSCLEPALTAFLDRRGK